MYRGSLAAERDWPYCSEYIAQFSLPSGTVNTLGLGSAVGAGAAAVIRLQHVYEMDQVAILPGASLGVQLILNDCKTIALAALESVVL